MDLGGSGQTTCNAPFLPVTAYPPTGGDITNRFCANLTLSDNTIECCLPCPATDWVYSDTFTEQSHIANYVSIASLVLNSLLLLTFIVLPEEKSHRHYMSIGLTVSLIMIAIAFVIPVGKVDHLCYNDITPHDLHTDLACGFTGALVEAGAMGVVVWILLRSIWTSLRIMTKFRHHTAFRNISLALGIGLPLLFLAISLSIAGVSYRLGNVCVPNKTSAMPTWFVWILIFSGISFLIQTVTILYCLWKFASAVTAGPAMGKTTTGQHMSKSSVSTAVTADSGHTKGGTSLTPARKRRVAWRKVKRLLLLQWRSIVLAFIVANLTVYFGIVFIQQNLTTKIVPGTENLTPVDLNWFVCLMANDGDKNACLSQASGLGLAEGRAIGTLVLASFIGILVFCLMVRWSMLVGWWELMRNPQQIFRRPSTGSEDFVMLSPRTATKAQMQSLESPAAGNGGDLRRRSSGQVVVRPSVDEPDPVVRATPVTPTRMQVSSPTKSQFSPTPTRTQFVDVPNLEKGKGKGRAADGERKEEEVMV